MVRAAAERFSHCLTASMAAPAAAGVSTECVLRVGQLAGAMEAVGRDRNESIVLVNRSIDSHGVNELACLGYGGVN